MVSIDHRLFKEPITGPLKSKMAEIRHLENRHDVIFFYREWIKFRRLAQNDMWTAVMWSNMADVWPHSVACHPKDTCHIAGYCHLANSMS